MAGAGDGNPPLRGDYRLLIDAITTQMERMMREHTEDLYRRIEQLENQENRNDDGFYLIEWHDQWLTCSQLAQLLLLGSSVLSFPLQKHLAVAWFMVSAHL